MAPSNIINVICWFANLPWNPPRSSAHRKTDRTKIASVARPKAHRKPLNWKVLRNSVKLGFRWLSEAWLALQANSVHRIAKIPRLPTCHPTPATMMLMPIWFWLEVVAPEAIAPPIAWSRREMKSKVMKVMV